MKKSINNLINKANNMHNKWWKAGLFALGYVTVVSGISIALSGIDHTSMGILTIPGYEEAVYLCGEGLTVNAGHEKDPQVQELIKYAEVKCAQLEAEYDAGKH